MSKYESNCFHIRLPGGLGNQLFGLYASRYIKEITGIQNHLDFGGVDYSHVERTYDLRSFDLDRSETAKCRKSLSLKRFSRLTNKLVRHLDFSPLNSINYGTTRFPLTNDSRLDVENFLKGQRQIKFDLNRLQIEDSYFADFEFFDFLNSKSNASLRLRHVSERFNYYFRRIHSEKTLAVHLRLGDFIENSESIGLLGDRYFTESIKKLTEFYLFEKLLVFSDSHLMAQARVSNWNISVPIEFVSSQGRDDPAEDLVLMSECQGIICSNSTFSFWAAKFASSTNKKVTHIVAPSQFRKDKATSVKSIPAKWHLENPFWV